MFIIYLNDEVLRFLDFEKDFGLRTLLYKVLEVNKIKQSMRVS